MEQLPAAGAEAADGGVETGQCQRHHEGEAGHAGDEEAAGGEVLLDDVEVPLDVDAVVVEGVEGGVEEGEEACHAAEAGNAALAGEAFEGCDAEADEEEAEGPVAGVAGDGFDAVDAEFVSLPTPGEQEEGDEAEKENNGFGETAVPETVHVLSILNRHSYYSLSIRKDFMWALL